MRASAHAHGAVAELAEVVFAPAEDSPIRNSQQRTGSTGYIADDATKRNSNGNRAYNFRPPGTKFSNLRSSPTEQLTTAFDRTGMGTADYDPCGGSELYRRRGNGSVNHRTVSELPTSVRPPAAHRAITMKGTCVRVVNGNHRRIDYSDPVRDQVVGARGISESPIAVVAPASDVPVDQHRTSRDHTSRYLGRAYAFDLVWTQMASGHPPIADLPARAGPPAVHAAAFDDGARVPPSVDLADWLVELNAHWRRSSIERAEHTGAQLATGVLPPAPGIAAA